MNTLYPFFIVIGLLCLACGVLISMLKDKSLQIEYWRQRADEAELRRLEGRGRPNPAEIAEWGA